MKFRILQINRNDPTYIQEINLLATLATVNGGSNDGGSNDSNRLTVRVTSQKR